MSLGHLYVMALKPYMLHVMKIVFIIILPRIGCTITDNLLLHVQCIALLTVLPLQHGTAPIHVACEKNYPHIVKLLLERGAKVDILDEVPHIVYTVSHYQCS